MGHLKYSYQKINLSLDTAIVNKRAESAGQRITHNAGTSTVSIKLNSNTNDEIEIQPQGSIIVPDGFDRFFISASQSIGNSVELIVSSPASMEFDNKALTVDTVAEITNIANLETVEQVTVNKLLERDISGYYDSLNNKNEFMGAVFAAPSGGAYACLQLLNPSGSGKTLILKKVIASTLANSIITMGLNASTLGAAGANGNKYLGEASPSGQVRSEVNGVLYALSPAMAFTYTQAYRPFINDFSRSGGIIIPEGNSLMVLNNTVATYTYASFEWKEI